MSKISFLTYSDAATSCKQRIGAKERKVNEAYKLEVKMGLENYGYREEKNQGQKNEHGRVKGWHR